MKYTNLPAFEKHLTGAAPNHFGDIYLVLAKEAFVRKQAVDNLVALTLKGESSPGLCLSTFDADKHSVDAILQDLETLSFFVKRRLVVVQNADAFDKASTTKLESYLAAPNRSVCLVLTATSLNRVMTFYKRLEKAGIVLDVAEEKPWEKEKTVSDWLHLEASKEGKHMSVQTCRTIVKQLGTDRALLRGELLKLVCYVGDKPAIEDSDVSAICTSVNLDNAWQLGEALFRRDVATALRISKALIADGVALIALLRQIRTQFQTEFQVCSILARGGTPADIGQEFPYMKGQILERHMRQAQSYGMQRFKKGLLTIDETELRAKNSGDPEFLVEMLVINLTL